MRALKNIKPIEGFKVMKWLRSIREREYNLYKQDPQEYFKQLRKAEKRIEGKKYSKNWWSPIMGI